MTIRMMRCTTDNLPRARLTGVTLIDLRSFTDQQSTPPPIYYHLTAPQIPQQQPSILQLVSLRLLPRSVQGFQFLISKYLKTL